MSPHYANIMSIIRAVLQSLLAGADVLSETHLLAAQNTLSKRRLQQPVSLWSPGASLAPAAQSHPQSGAHLVEPLLDSIPALHAMTVIGSYWTDKLSKGAADAEQLTQ